MRTRSSIVGNCSFSSLISAEFDIVQSFLRNPWLAVGALSA
jgi:hypothetical protein